MGRRTPGRRVPPRGPGGRRVPPPPPGRPSPRGSAPSPRPIGGIFGAIGPAVTAANADKLRGPVTRVPASAFKGKVFDSRTGLDKGPVKEPVRSKDPEPGSFESLLNKIEQQKKEAQAKTGSSSLSFRDMAETMKKNKEEKARQAFLEDIEEKAKREQADAASGMAVPGFSATKFLELKDKINPDFKDLTEGGTKNPSDIFRSKLEDIKRKKEEGLTDMTQRDFDMDSFKAKLEEIRRKKEGETQKGITGGITKEGRPEFDGDSFRAKLEEIRRKKGIRGGARPVARTGGKPRTVRRTGGRPAPFFSPRPTRPPVRYGIGGPFGTRTFFGSRPSRPAPFFSPRPTRPPVRYGLFNLLRRPY